MKRIISLTVMVSFALLALTSITSADVPPEMHYQGHLTDDGGAPLDTIVSMTFTIYNDSGGGAVLWTETQTGVEVSGGLFNVLLGSVTPIPDTAFADDWRWLGIQIGSDPEIAPLTKLVTVPYAFRVSTVDGATGGTISGDVAIQSDLDVDGDLRATGKATIGPNHTNTHNYTFVAGYSNTASHNYATVSGGKDNTASGVGSAVGGGFENTANGWYAMVPGGRGNTAGGTYSFAAGIRANANHNGTFVWADQTPVQFASTGEDQFLIRAAGGVGIGTNNPGGFDLAVNGTAAKTGGGSWSVFSDVRLKKVLGACDYGLSEIIKLKPVRYSYKEDNLLGLPTGQEYVGLVAQEVQTVIPDAVEENDQGYLMVNNDPIIWAMLSAIKELNAENQTLRAQLVETNAQLTELTDLVQTILAKQNDSKSGNAKLAVNR